MSQRTRGAELTALTAIAAQVNCTQNLDEILHGALDTTLQVIGVDAGEIFLLDEETGELVLHAEQGLSAAFIAEETLIGGAECLCGLSAESGRVVMASNIADHPARSRPACLREGFQSLLCLPLRGRDQVLGVLNVQSRRRRHFTAADSELLTAIGNQIGIAIANARLIDDAEQRRATLHSVMNSMVDGLILLDRRGRVTYANPYAAGLLGLPITALVGVTVPALDAALADRISTSPPRRAPLQAATAARDREEGVEFTLDGHAPRTVQARFFEIHSAGNDSLGLGLLLRVVTREKELDQMKSQLLSTVSHELRTPLASIKGFATTLLRRDVVWDEPSRHEFLAIIDQESDRLSELISNLLDMSRIEAGTLRVNPESTDLWPMFHEVVGDFQVLTHEHQFVVDLPASLPPVWADPRRARQVLRNLVENAVKYSPGGGQITLSARQLAGSLEIGVADRGIGIAPEHVGRVFDRFYQVDSASTRQVGGSGLGLSICKAIVEAHHGRVWAESEPGVGSVFRFTLPLAVGALPESSQGERS